MAAIDKRITSSGQVRWRARVRQDGQPPFSKTFRIKKDAQDWSQEIEANLKKGISVPTNTQKRISLRDVIDRYIEYLPLKPKNKNLKAPTQHLEYWKSKLGNVALLNLTPDMVVKVRDELAKGNKTRANEKRSGGTVNRYLGSLSTCLSHCIREWTDYGLKENPVFSVTRLKEPEGRSRFLSDHERSNLLEACKNEHQELFEIVVLALTCGARKGELENIKWLNVNFDRQSIKIVDTKNGESRHVPLVGQALNLLKAKQKKSKEPYVFAHMREHDRLHKAFKRALATTNIEEFRFHDLRHSAASYLAMNGASLAELSDILGHKTLAMVKRYSHFCTGHHNKLASKMAESIGL